MHEFTDDQKKSIADWIESGASIAEVQKRLLEEFQVSLTYMDTRFLVDDLRLLPRDPDEPEEPTPGEPVEAEAELVDDGPHSGGVHVSLDQITKPSAIVSGKVTFSDGQKAEWYLDQLGRLGLTAATEGYRPSDPDLITFQQELQKLVAGSGY